MPGRMFRLYFPEGHPGTAHLDWEDFQARGIVRAWIDEADRIHLGFATPFQALSFVNHETITVQKVAQLKAALHYFGAPMPETHR